MFPIHLNTCILFSCENVRVLVFKACKCFWNDYWLYVLVHLIAIAAYVDYQADLFSNLLGLYAIFRLLSKTVKDSCQSPRIKFYHIYFFLHKLIFRSTRWRLQMEAFFALLALCVRNSPINSPRKGQWHELWCVSVKIECGTWYCRVRHEIISPLQRRKPCLQKPLVNSETEILTCEWLWLGCTTTVTEQSFHSWRYDNGISIWKTLSKRLYNFCVIIIGSLFARWALVL